MNFHVFYKLLAFKTEISQPVLISLAKINTALS